ncbi:fungal-specific transcription factor domain-containing protein [Xylogone sp. PMI_703]|nr:fungal-specific transcription factor domain-containing protein [Xylogone sp. PMI_703]
MSEPAAKYPPTGRRYACIECYKRKIRCDRLSPCAHCRRAELDCRYKSPLPPKRRKQYENIVRLERLEQIVENFRQQGSGVPSNMGSGIVKNVDRKSWSVAFSGTQIAEKSDTNTLSYGIIVKDRDGVQYIETPILINLAEAVTIKGYTGNYEYPGSETIKTYSRPSIQSLNGMLHQYPLFGPNGVKLGSSYFDFCTLRPNPTQSHLLWRSFVLNCHPILKLFNPAVAERIISQEIKSISNEAGRDTAFSLSVFTLAILSMEDKECQIVMKISRSVLLMKYLQGMEAALAAVDILGTSRLTDLQAFILYIFCLQAQMDHGKLWTVTGIAVRIAQKMGLNLDGEALGLDPYDTELRRRLWWHIILLDNYTAEHTGSSRSLNAGDWNVGIPQDIDDSDLCPDLSYSNIDLSREVPGDMFYSRTRFEMLAFLHRVKSPSGRDSGISYLLSVDVSLADREAIIDDLEQFMQRKYLTKANPSRPIHMLAMNVAHAVMTRLRLLALYPRNLHQSLPEEQHDRLLALSIRCLDYDANLYSDSQFQNFHWHIRGFFHWAPLLALLMEIRRRPPSFDLERAWDRIHAAYERHSELIEDQQRMLHCSVAKLVLLAWDAHGQGKMGELSSLSEPLYIGILRNTFGSAPRDTNQSAAGLTGEHTMSPFTHSFIQRSSIPYQQDPIQQFCEYANSA